jgi:hypothetical protein
MIWLAWGCLSLGSALCLISLWMRGYGRGDAEDEVPGGRDAAIERCHAAWVDHWNNEHVKEGRPWGGQCCIEMCTDAVLGTYVPSPGWPEPEVSGLDAPAAAGVRS